MKKILSICTLFTVLLISSCLSGTDPVLEGSQSPDNPQALRVGDFIVVDKEVDHSSGRTKYIVYLQYWRDPELEFLRDQYAQRVLEEDEYEARVIERKKDPNRKLELHTEKHVVSEGAWRKYEIGELFETKDLPTKLTLHLDLRRS